MLAKTEVRWTGEYLLTEREISARCGRAIPHPIRLFDLETLGIDRQAFGAAIEPTYADLPWDTYDVRRAQIAHAIAHNPGCLTGDNVALMKRYYLADPVPGLLGRLAALVPPDQRRHLYDFSPCRRRASSSYRLTFDGGSPRLLALPQSDFRQEQVADYRTWPRSFAPMPLAAEDSPPLYQFLVGVGQMVLDVEPVARCMKLTVHQVSTVARNGKPGTNSPEGIHQDGADYIVSALVVSRSGVEGGISQLYGEDRREAFFSTKLAPGQGLFHADAQTCIWHDATPISCVDTRGGTSGFRNTIGVDVYLEG